MKLKYNVSEQDYINFNIDHFYNASKMKGSRLSTMFGPVIIFFVVLFILADYTFLLSNSIATLVFALVWISGQPLIQKSSIKSTTKAYLKSGKDNSFIGEQEMILADEYIEGITSKVTMQVKYSSVEKILFGHNLIYVYIGAIEALILPIIAFENNEELNKFFKTMSEKTGIDFSEEVKKIEKAKQK